MTHFKVETAFTCPISRELFKVPVLCIADSITYDFTSFQSLLSSQYQRGATGISIGGSQCTLNRALFSQVNAYREENGLETFSVPPVLLAGIWPARATPAAQPRQTRAPPAPRATYQPQTSISDIMAFPNRPTLTQLFQTDGFLNTMTIDGMNVLMQKITGNFELDFMRNLSKGSMIAQVMEVNQIHVLDQLVPLIDCSVLLSTIQIAGLDLILRCLGVSHAGDKDAKIRVILRFLPLSITVQDVHGEHSMTVQRKSTVTEFAADVLMARSHLLAGTNVMQLSDCLSMHDLRSGTVIRNAAASSTDAQGSAEEIALTAALLDKAGFQDYDAGMFLVVKDQEMGIHVIEGVADDTIADVKAKLEAEGVDIEDTRVIFAGKPVVDDHKIREYKLRTGSVLHLVDELEGGARKGAK
jgi:hypothetical protein